VSWKINLDLETFQDFSGEWQQNFWSLPQIFPDITAAHFTASTHTVAIRPTTAAFVSFDDFCIRPLFLWITFRLLFV
jgi:hypothetical protein